MSVQTAMAPDIVLKSNEDEFDKAIKSMTLRELMQGVSSLQKEMAKEQENFNGLTSEIQTINKNSRQYKHISKEMVTSQNRLTNLMNRSMKCFSQQALVKADEKENTLPRRNSFKESPPMIQPKKPPVSVQRSMSARFPQEDIPNSNSISEKATIVSAQRVKSNEIQPPGTPEFLKVKLRPSGAKALSEEKKLNRMSDSHVTTQKTSRNIVTFNNINLSTNVRPVAKITPNNSRSNDMTDSELKKNIINYHKASDANKPLVIGREDSDKKVVTTQIMLSPSHRSPQSLVTPNRRYSSALEQSTVNNFEISTSELKTCEESPELDSSPNRFVSVNRITPLRVTTGSTARNSAPQASNDTQSTQKVSLNILTPQSSVMQNAVKEEKVDAKQPLEKEEQNSISVETKTNDSEDGSGSESDDEIPPELLDEEECIQSQPWEAMRTWDPTKLLNELFRVNLISDHTEDISHQFVTMEGYMEKLPQGKKKATLLKTWKRRFFRAKDGWLYYFDTNSRDKASDSLQLMGGRIEDLGNRMLGIDDGRGRYIMVRCPTEMEHGQWKVALESQTADNTKSTYIKPVLNSPQNHSKKVVIVDLGSNAIRAGILGEQPSLPQLFFPSIVSINEKTGEKVVGFDAYKPDNRLSGELEPPVRPTNKTEKGKLLPFNINLDLIPDVFKKIFTDLNVDSKRFWVMLSTPQNLNDTLKQKLMNIFMDEFKVLGVCMVSQSLLSLYSYNTTSGIIVDIGERMEIMPIYDGLLIEGGITRQSYGGKKIQESLFQSLMADNYRLQLPIEQLIVKHVMEKSCFVVDNYHRCLNDPVKLKTKIHLGGFDLPEGTYTEISHDVSCYKSPEGIFNTDLWEMDYKNLPKLVYKAIQESPMDSRRHMYRSIYLSGGVTMLPGFADRLHSELVKLAPPSVVIQIHASPQRYHSAYIGACSVAAMSIFEHTCITAKEWKEQGVKAFRKWATNS